MKHAACSQRRTVYQHALYKNYNAGLLDKTKRLWKEVFDEAFV